MQVYAATDLSPWPRAVVHRASAIAHLLRPPRSWLLGTGLPEPGHLVLDPTTLRSVSAGTGPVLGNNFGPLDAGGNGLSPEQSVGSMLSQVRRLLDQSMQDPVGYGGEGTRLERVQAGFHSPQKVRRPPSHLRTRTWGDPGGCIKVSELSGVRRRVSFVYLFVFRLCFKLERAHMLRKGCGKTHSACVLTFLQGALERWIPNLKCVHRLWAGNPEAASFS